MSWFKPKRYGYGASPANWKGWAASLGFLVMEIGLVWILLLEPIIAWGELSTVRFVIWAVFSGALTFGFIWLTKVKTDGDWRWRWGEKE